MLGKEVMFLFLILIAGSAFSNVYANENSSLILLETNKSEYYTGDKLTISGTVLEKKMPVIAMRIYDPDNGILSANNVEINEDGTFSKTIFLDAPFYEKKGTYNISFDYGKEKSQIELVILDENFSESEIIEEISIKPEIVVLVSDKNEYLDGEYVVISGLVSSPSDQNVLVGIYDTFGFPAGFYFGDVDENLEFTISFLIKDGVNFKTYGTYSAIAYYGESEDYVEFDFVEIKTIEDLPEITDEPIIEVEIPDYEEPSSSELEISNEIIPEETINEIIPEETINEIIPEETINEIIPEETINEIIPEETINEVTLISTSNIESDKNQISTKTIIEEKPLKPIQENNLSVEDVALGIMLNQITLSCDDDDYVDSISYYDGMGPALMRLCNFEDAIHHFDVALIDEPKNVEILTNKGSALSKLGFYDESIIFFDSAIEIDPNFLPALNNKANSLINLGKFESAIENYNLILEIDPNFSLAQKNLNFAQQEFSNNLETLSFENSNTPSLNSVTQITNKVADTTITTVNQINENPSNVFEQIGVVFSMIGSSFFNFIE